MVGVADTHGRPSLDVVRNMTDGQVLGQLLTVGQMSRAQIADHTGISRPTVSESVRRLMAHDLVMEAGRERGGRGRAGILLQVRPDVGFALVVSAGPDGARAEALDPRGEPVAAAAQTVVAPLEASDLDQVLTDVVDEVLSSLTGPVLTTAVSVADPVDQLTGRTVDLPNAPFLVGELAPRDVLTGPLTDHARSWPVAPDTDDPPEIGPVEVDNDVHWAVLAEQQTGAAQGHDHVVLLHLGPGLGAGTVANGQVVRGARGLAGEIAHLPTPGPNGRTMPLQRVFASLDLLVDGTAAIDVDAVTTALADGGPPSRTIVGALASACTSIAALLNPDLVLLGGPWSSPELAHQVDAAATRKAPVPLHVTAAAFSDDGPLRGARLHAATAMRTILTGRHT